MGYDYLAMTLISATSRNRMDIAKFWISCFIVDISSSAFKLFSSLSFFGFCIYWTYFFFILFQHSCGLFNMLLFIYKINFNLGIL